MKIELIVIGRLKNGAMQELCEDYSNRIKTWDVSILEFDSKHKDPNKAQKDEEDFILSKLKSEAFKIILDERGKALKCVDFSKNIQRYQMDGVPYLQFVIGGADGHRDTVRKQANFLLSFGVQTWPHKLARVMILEQIYRAQQILLNHPYHRE